MQTDWDIRLASLLLLALDTKDNFWQLYGDYLPGVDDSTSLLLASEVRKICLGFQGVLNLKCLILVLWVITEGLNVHHDLDIS